MLRLTSASLAVDLLDPSDPADAARLGARFCHGGFIWQVYALAPPSAPSGAFPSPTPPTLAPLLSGPEYPSLSPDPFNAQGLPESFRHRTRDGAPLTWDAAGTAGLALGAGTLGLAANGQPTLLAPCAWSLTRAPAADSASFHTRHAAAGFSYALTRRITVRDRVVVSTSVLTNLAARPLALQWFAHPFWALTGGTARLSLPAGTALPENPGFALAPDGTLTFRRPFVAPDDTQFSLLALPPGPPLALSVTHPALSRVTFATSFVPSECPVWANARTLSVEPYLALSLAPGETREWHVRHGFEP